jgi:hypothetical protein
MNVATEFNIVQFTPDPEIEPANVALLLKLERPRLVLTKFPQRHAAPWFDHQPLAGLTISRTR